MTCKDCIHYEACNIVEHLTTIFKNNAEKECNDFKNRSKFIELPCKVGDTIFRICPVPRNKGCRSCPWEYCDCHDIGYQKEEKNTIREVKAKDFAWIIKRTPYFGKIYFLTREEAEQALRERN